jgi:hypothetical protein
MTHELWHETLVIARARQRLSPLRTERSKNRRSSERMPVVLHDGQRTALL